MRHRKGESKKKPDVSVALAVSRMLLGRPEDAEAALGLTKEATVIPDPAVQKFVLVGHISSRSIPLPMS